MKLKSLTLTDDGGSQDGGFVGKVTVGYSTSAIPEPTSMAVLGLVFA